MSGEKMTVEEMSKKYPNEWLFIVDFRITWTLCRCRRELRFPTIKAFSRDSEIAPTEEV